jgi:riboflavin kinase/FMN adenylyltransferase
MHIITNLDDIPESFRGGAASIGKFDGMHLGHSQIIRRLKNHADKRHIPSLVLTFDPLPAIVLHPDREFQPICTLERKIELIRSYQVDAFVLFRTDIEFLCQSAETFFFETLHKKLNVKVVVEGQNFCFGFDRLGTAESMRRYGKQAGIEIDLVESVQIDKHLVSSSEIRRLLQEGKAEQVVRFMPQPYRLTGTVIYGEQRGRTLGFPTANLGEIKTIIPKQGIYATIATFDDQTFDSTTHIGTNPTFNVTTPKIEVFIHNFDGNLYGKTVHVDFLGCLRGIIRFSSADELIRQMNLDVQNSRKICFDYQRSLVNS